MAAETPQVTSFKNGLENSLERKPMFTILLFFN